MRTDGQEKEERTHWHSRRSATHERVAPRGSLSTITDLHLTQPPTNAHCRRAARYNLPVTAVAARDMPKGGRGEPKGAGEGEKRRGRNGESEVRVTRWVLGVAGEMDDTHFVFYFYIYLCSYLSFLYLAMARHVSAWTVTKKGGS